MLLDDIERAISFPPLHLAVRRGFFEPATDSPELLARAQSAPPRHTHCRLLSYQRSHLSSRASCAALSCRADENPRGPAVQTSWANDTH
jgi:hypothetical protein